MTTHQKSEASLTPRAIVAFLDRYIVGQDDAKKAVAIALRNRWRRKMVPGDLREEIMPKNIIMIGPTGVGKTEIARRLAKLAAIPFIKVEASKFTEVGYVGRDVDSMVRDLMEASVAIVRREEEERVRNVAHKNAENRILDLLMPTPTFEEMKDEGVDSTSRRREKIRQQLQDGLLDDRRVQVEVEQKGAMPMMSIFSNAGMEEMGLQMQNMFGNMLGGGGKKKDKTLPVKEALRVMDEEEAANLIDQERVVEVARERLEQTGIIFLDELDKIAGRESGHGPNVSREGVQRDLLPLIEGTTVATKYGPVKTDHVLFIAAGAFHVSKPSELIPELQGRFPIRVELAPLSAADFRRILVEPENSLVKQYIALLATEQVTLEFTDDACDAIAELAVSANDRLENIGARRLYTVMEKLVEEISFTAPDMPGGKVVFNRLEVESRLKHVIADEDMSKYVL